MDCINDQAEWIAYLSRAIKRTRTMAVWSSVPWFIGWATLTVMGPVVAVRLVYRVVQAVVSRAFFNDKALCGKVVLITGASSGLGEAIAHSLYKRGARLILASRNTDKLNELKETLLKTYKPPELHVPTVVKLDLEDLHSIPEIVDNLLKTHGHVDVLINNAGISYRGAAMETDISVDIKLMVVNYFGQVALTKAVLPSMVRRQSGHIVAIGSVQGRLAIPYRSCYTASKHALQGFFDSLRAEVSGSRVLVSVVSPGYISTNLSLNAVTGDGSTYGAMDATTASGTSPEKVAEHIVGCITNGHEELVLAPLSHQLAIVLRTLAPSLLSRLMKSRAGNQKNVYVHKED
ncbi:dehydrogenase/reductase SDR family protein 7-like [Procambarus clarkii]|uniref:dehydrogenase/reductase SDR family protein 7-like n=1 Tax=Procambarus clarkii TaxID=6728 RepID=UPI001E677059|nr:dehydrogenase/reductase SDR family protein 7-like [Procambarus clarkii]XP_045614450.1 dehydrogenase/reductase SDR family protein 7-like [Procambarus clarkii]XP_045614451.1 dehydrogenase/reductase SDR family protein 7-like [Procambarus clarkii]